MVDIASNCLDENVISLMQLFPDTITFVKTSLWNIPSTISSVDWIYCCDVLEHLPAEKIDKALTQMADRMKKGGFLQVFLKDEPFGLMIGKKLHLTIRSKKWWIQKLSSYWKIEGFGPEIKNSRFTLFVTSLR